MDQHAGHTLEALRALEESCFPAGSPGDPMAVGYLKVTDGQQEFLLRRSRSTIAEPVRFERIEGRLTEDPAASLEIQESELRKELRLRFRCHDGGSLSDAKVELFIKLFRTAVRQLQASSVTLTQRSCKNDTIAYAALPAGAGDFLLEQCAVFFTAAEVRALRTFLQAHGAGSDVMTLVVRRRIALAEPF
jgi:hypothetical protein